MLKSAKSKHILTLHALKNSYLCTGFSKDIQKGILI